MLLCTTESLVSTVTALRIHDLVDLIAAYIAATQNVMILIFDSNQRLING